VSSEAPEPLVCRSYTHARRHPNVIGVIGGWVLPWPITPTQLGVLLASVAMLLWTRPIWSVLPKGLHLMILAGGPLFLTWAVRHLRMEGRTPVRMAAGAMGYVGRPRQGRHRGRSCRQAKPQRLQARVFVGAKGLGATSNRRRRRRLVREA
jgi:hypothetical protein